MNVGIEVNIDANSESNKTLAADLVDWILKFQIRRNASNELLSILRKHGHDELPKCTRTILKTPRSISSEKKCGGDYKYLGIANGISRKLAAEDDFEFTGQSIELLINVDGLPLYT